MARRRALLFGLLVAVVVLGVSAWATWPRPSAITPENAARIEKGMTLAEVEGILGGPARDETPEDERRHLVIQSVRPDLEWNSDLVSVWIHLDADGRVRECHAIPVPPQGPLAFLRRWLRP
jgi:outer membrane protein assembly factor BamE (lipoprotein component of BamABCDE complex)